MPRKRKTSHPPRERPPWFNIALDAPSPWSLRVQPDKADEWLGGIDRLWGNPETAAFLASFWEKFRDGQVQIKADLEAMDWVTVIPWELVKIVWAYVDIQIAVETFLPQPYADALPPPARRSLYVQALMLVGLTAVEDNPEDPLCPPEILESLPQELRLVSPENRVLLPALKAACFYLAGPFAEAEIVRRGAGHVGYHAGMLLLLMQIFRRMGSETPDLAQEAEHRVDQLRGSTFRSTPVEMREELTGQIPLTLDSRWGHLDGLEVIARSLEGELNIAPQAIRDGLMKQKVREDERRTMEIHFSSLTRQTRSTEEKEGEEIPYDPKDPRQGHDPKDPKGGPQDKAHWRGLLKRMRNHPRPQRLLDAVLEGDKTQREIAERYGVTDRTVRSWITEAKQLLEED